MLQDLVGVDDVEPVVLEREAIDVVEPELEVLQPFGIV